MQKSGRLELTWAGKSYETESFEPRLLVEDKEKSYAFVGIKIRTSWIDRIIKIP